MSEKKHAFVVTVTDNYHRRVARKIFSNMKIPFIAKTKLYPEGEDHESSFAWTKFIARVTRAQGDDICHYLRLFDSPTSELYEKFSEGIL